MDGLEEEVPELVFDEEYLRRVYGIDEATRIGWAISGEVEDEVGEGIVVAHFVA